MAEFLTELIQFRGEFFSTNLEEDYKSLKYISFVLFINWPIFMIFYLNDCFFSTILKIKFKNFFPNSRNINFFSLGFKKQFLYIQNIEHLKKIDKK
jgi:hypothetical protein